MKWLILLALISCGKHEEPKKADLRDYDGDQRVAEVGFDKYSAHYEELGAIEGSVSFNSAGFNTIEFSNQYDPSTHATRLIVGDSTYAERSQYFAEGSKLKLDVKKQITVKGEAIQVTLLFKRYWKDSSELILTYGKTERSFGSWTEHMNISLSKEELEALLDGRAVLRLLKKFKKDKTAAQDSGETIKEKTYKVIISDGKSTKIYYIAKDFTYEQLLAHFKISRVVSVDDELLFFDAKAMSGTQWFERKYDNEDVVLVKSTLQELKKEFQKKFKVEKLALHRVNGVPTNALVVSEIKNNKIFLKVRGNSARREFAKNKRSETKRIHSGMSQLNSRCDFFSKDIKKETAFVPDIDALLKNIDLMDVQDVKYREQEDEKGLFWEVILYTGAEALEFQLKPRAEATYTVTGDYDAKCSFVSFNSARPRKQTKTNDEAFLKFEIESFVERSE